jgi:hypothetical protein
MACTTVLLSTLAPLAACGSSDDDDGPPVVSDVTPSATDDPDGTDYDVSLVVDFTGNDVSAYTFETTNLDDGEVDDNDVALPGDTTSPVTIDGIVISMADDGGDTSVDCELALYDDSGEGTLFPFTLTITPSVVKLEPGTPHRVTAPASLRH